jgi:Transcriptional regulator
MIRARRLPAKERKRRIIESARDVFAASNYWKVSTADLAKAAGISEPALYRHFSGKKDIFLSTLRDAAPKLVDTWQRIAEDVDDPIETLWTIGLNYYDHVKSRSAVTKLQFQALIEADDPEIQTALHRNFLSFVQFLRHMRAWCGRTWTAKSSPGSVWVSGSAWTFPTSLASPAT